MNHRFTRIASGLLLLGWLLGLRTLSAQAPGDLAFVGFNADGDDGFAFVTLVDLPANTPIWFTDEEWDNTTSTFGTGEGDVVWSHTALVPAGTVIDIDGVSATPAASLGTVVAGSNGGSGYSASGEQLYAYLGTERNPTTFLTAFTNGTFGATELPAALSLGSTAIEFGTGEDVFAYTGPRLGQATFAAYAPLIYDLTNNWITEDGSGDQHNNGTAPDVPFDLTPFATGSADLIPPLLQGATLVNPTTIQLAFNEALDQTTAEDVANYTFSPTLAINSATLLGADSVELSIAALPNGIAHVLSVLGVADTAGNPITTAETFIFFANVSQPDLVISEILYNNPGNDSLEFLEIYNHGSVTAELGGMTFIQGITYTFDELSVAPGGTALIAADTAAANSFFGVSFDGQFGGALSNGGEDLILVNTVGDTIDLVDYDDASPWPIEADGDGPSMELLNPALDNNDGNNWVAATNLVGQTLEGADVFASPGTVTVVSGGTISMADPVLTVSEGALAAALVVQFSGSIADTAKVKVVLTSFATATNGSDFMAMDTVKVAFAPGALTQTDTLEVAIMDDSDVEQDEYFSFRLIDPENVEIGSTSGSVVYTKDNDRMAPMATEAISLSLLTSYENSPGAGNNAAEIVAFDPLSRRMFISNSENNSMDIVDLSDPANPVAVSSIDISSFGAINSVAVYDTLVAAAIENATKTQPGMVVFFDTDGNVLNQLMAGALPDMVTFTPDGTKALVANEGEPSDDYSVDPEGSIVIIDMTQGVGNLTQANVTIADFSAFNGQEAALAATGVRITGPNASVAQDLEPEYITISASSDTAWVTCQENNAVAVIDLTTNTVVSVLGLGFKDYSLAGAGLDATNDFDSVNLANYPLFGTYMPDAIASYEVGGVTYLITANEGDAREYEDGPFEYLDETRLRDLDLDTTAFPHADLLQQAIGRIKIINTEGDTDNDGDFDALYTFGARSFSIWNGSTGAQVYDSGDAFELITSQDPVFGAIFNTTDDELDFKDRSDDKGPEPEGVTTGMIGGRTYAFVLLERIGGVMVYDVTDPAAPVFVQYVNNRSTTDETVGDLAPEGVQFISSAQSPNGKPLLLVANEVSSTVSVYEISEAITGTVAFAETEQTVGEDLDSLSVEVVLTNGNADSTITVNIELGTFATAEESTDFTAAATTTVTFMPGMSSVTVSFDLIDDTDPENDEYFTLRLANPANATLGEDAAHVAFINDDDRLAPVASGAIELLYVTSYVNGVAGDDAAEIAAYDSSTHRIFLANSEANEINIVDFSDPTNPVAFADIDVSTYGGINSVAIFNGIVAAAIENDNKQQPGSVVFFDNAGTFLSQVTAGALPDMVTFTPDGSKVLVANEGEPNDDYSVDPEGSVSIIDISGGVANVTAADVTTADFTAFNSQEVQLKADGVRIFGPNATVAQDLEPEYIALSADGATAYVTLQENNALAIVDVNAGTVSSILPLGYKDHSLPGMGLDAEDRSDSVRIANYPILGMYMPDAIESFTTNGMEYLITANEGDAREYDTYEEEVRLGSSSYVLDSAAFPDGDLLKASIGRITTTFASGDTDGDGDYDEVHVFGARSFSIWEAATGALVYDSGDELELITSQDPVFGPFFNSTNDELAFKNRSDNKGPEPEAVVVGEIENEQYAFIGLERIGGVMVYKVTNPAAPEFVQYVNSRSTPNDGGDLAPESIVLVDVNESPDGKYYVLVANEVSSTLTVYEVDGILISRDEALEALALRVFPNPTNQGVTIELPGQTSPEMEVRVLTVDGRELMRKRSLSGFNSLTLEVGSLPAGLYLLDVTTAEGRATQRLVVR